MSENTQLKTKARRFFWAVTAYPKTILALGALSIIIVSVFIPAITKDTTPDSFVPRNHPALLYRKQVKEIFGLKDPMIIAVINEGSYGVFNPDSLSLVSWLTDRVSEIPGIDPERVTSLSTEDNVIGTEEGMFVVPFFERPPETQAEADDVRRAVMDFPLYLGSLVSRDGKATLVVAELLNEAHPPEVYKALLALVQQAPVGQERLHVAGEGAVSGYLAFYIDADFRQLVPLSALIIFFILLLCFRTLAGVVVPHLIVLAAVLVPLGGMAASGVPVYVVTNALPVILIGIAVADAVHILSQYYEEMSKAPNVSHRERIVSVMTQLWRPVTITSLTSMAGFMGVAGGSSMPPMQAFGIFAALGIGVAWLFSIFMIPASIIIMKKVPSPSFRLSARNEKQWVGDRCSRILRVLGAGVAENSSSVLIVAAVMLITGVIGAMNLDVNDQWVDNFQKTEPIYQADRTINRLMDGTSYLDVVVETEAPEGLFEPENLRRIEALQAFLETQAHVNGTTSIVDYLKQMNRAMNGNQPGTYGLPDEADLVAQYFLLHDASGDPSNLEDKIDYDYRMAHVRGMMDTGLYQDVKTAVEAMQRYINETFDDPSITATLSGRVTVDYHWFELLFGNHFRSVAITFFAIWFMAVINFRSAMLATLAMIPVVFSILLTYAVMGLFGIRLAVGTSMASAISMGIGIDFSVHTIDRLRVLLRKTNGDFKEAVSALFPSTGRALFFNFAAVFFGFGVLVVSRVPSLRDFGFLVAVSVLLSFVASMTILPALFKILNGAWLGFEKKVLAPR